MKHEESYRDYQFSFVLRSSVDSLLNLGCMQGFSKLQMLINSKFTYNSFVLLPNFP